MSDLPSPAEIIQSRREALLQKYADGRKLDDAQLSEIKSFLHSPVSEISPITSEDGDSERFSLDPSAPLPAKLRGYYRRKLADYTPDYNRGERAIKRWVSCGRNAQPKPDLPPLDEPEAMAAWWRRMFPKEAVPLELLDHESRGKKISSAAAGAAAASGEADDETRHADPILLTGADVGSAESVRRSAASENAYFRLHEQALAAGNRDEARKWRTEYADAAELTNKLRRQHREQMKADGEWIPRGHVVAELAQMVEALRLAHGAMGGKVIADLERRTSGRRRRVLQLLAPEIAASIETVRRRESDLLASIESVRSPEAARDAFTLAA